MEQFGGGTKGREKELRDYQKRQQFTHIPKHFGSSKAQLEKKADAAFAKHQKEALETDKPAYWRCVIEMLHIAGLGPRKRGSMYAANGAQVAVEFRLFGQTVRHCLQRSCKLFLMSCACPQLRTGFVPASPPVTLMDSRKRQNTSTVALPNTHLLRACRPSDVRSGAPVGTSALLLCLPAHFCRDHVRLYTSLAQAGSSGRARDVMTVIFGDFPCW